MSSHARENLAAPRLSRFGESASGRPIAFVGVSAGLLAVAAFFGANPWWVAALAILILGALGFWAAAQRTEIRRLVEARRVLAASDWKFRRLYENVAVALLAVERDGTSRSENPALLRVLSYRSESDFLAADFREHTFSGPGTYNALLLRTRKGGELPVVELHLRRRDGVQLTAAGSIRVCWDDAGEVTGFEFTLLDISDLKVAERQRRWTERRFRRLFDSNAVGIMFGNLCRGTFVEANERLRELVQLRASELPVLLDGLVSTEDASLIDSIRASVESGGHEPPVDCVYVRGDGTRVAASVCAAITDSLQGDCIAVVVERGDRSGALAGAATASRLHESMLDSVPLLVARLDATAAPTFCNLAFRDWFGFPSSPLGWSFEEPFGVKWQRVLAARLDRVLEGVAQKLGIDVFRAAGHHHRLEALLAPHRRRDGSVGGFLVVIRQCADRVESGIEAAPVPVHGETTYNI